MNPLVFAELLSRVKNPSSTDDFKVASRNLNVMLMAIGCSIQAYDGRHGRFVVLYVMLPSVYERRGKWSFINHSVDVVLRHTIEGWHVDKNRFFRWNGCVSDLERFLNDCRGLGRDSDEYNVPNGQKFIHSNQLAEHVRNVKKENEKRTKRYRGFK